MNQDTRTESFRLLGRVVRTAPRVAWGLLLAAFLALATWSAPLWTGQPDLFATLPQAGRITLAILVFAAVLWMTEAVPAFAVSVLVIGLQIAMLGRPGGPLFEAGDRDGWRLFVDPWSSPLIWLFLGGFVLAQGAAATGLDRWFAMHLLQRSGGRPAALLAGCMALTFVLSMFMSNTATATMMIAVLAPLLASRPLDDRLGRGLILGVAAAANLGGMGTVIGSPPNAIAVAQLPPGEGVDFLRWMAFGLPVGLVLLVLSYFYLRALYRDQADGGEAPFHSTSLQPSGSGISVGPEGRVSLLHHVVVMAVFAVTVTMWMTEAWHRIPAPVISFIPITIFSVTGVMTAKSMRALPWDVLLLIAGGLSLGVAVKESGLAVWLAGGIPENWSYAAIGFGMAFVAVGLSSLMSNTATASILLPILAGIALGSGESAALLIPVALACSTAMVLPISTPPNAIACTSGRLRVLDLAALGGLLLLVGPLLAIFWSRLVAPWLL